MQVIEKWYRDAEKHRYVEWRSQEIERHDLEMRWNHHESEREWRERQEQERQRHDNRIRIIEAGLVDFLIDS